MPGVAGRVPDALIAIPVWSYWTGPQPAWIGLCLETLRRNSPTARILDDTYWTSGDYTGEIPVEDILRQTPAHRSDILRAWLLYRHGGIWVDADAVVWRDLRPIARHFRRRDFVAYRSRGNLCTALMAAPLGSPTAARHWRNCVGRMATGRRLRQDDVGPDLLLRTLRQAGRHRVHYLAEQNVHPLHWTRRDELLTDTDYQPSPWAWTFMLGRGSLGQSRHASRETLLSGSTLIARLFRRAIGTTTNPQIWTYWTGPQPAWIGLCLETLRHNSPTAKILDETYWTSADYTGEISAETILRQPPAAQADALRAWLLYRHGGIWVDADCIVYRDLRGLANQVADHDFATYRCFAGPHGVANALLVAKPDSPVAAAYWSEIVSRLRNNQKTHRASLGPKLLVRAIRKTGWHHVQMLPSKLIHPFDWRPRRRRRLLRQNEIYVPPADAWTCMLTHRSIGRLEHASDDKILASKTLLGQLFRLALLAG
jgi:hypothetical protein